MRSTMAPEISAAVMMAKVPWYAMNSRCGMVPLGARSTPFSSALLNPPSHGEPSENDRL